MFSCNRPRIGVVRMHTRTATAGVAVGCRGREGKRAGKPLCLLVRHCGGRDIDQAIEGEFASHA
ncbi:hypothetical protein KOXY103107_05010 [Komagataeibacter xylinus]